MTKTETVKPGVGTAPAPATVSPTPTVLAPPEAIDGALDANRAIMDEMIAVNHDFTTFIGKRMRADMTAFTRLCRCRDFTEAMGVQVEFMSRLAEDYFEEATKLTERAARMMEQGPIRGAEAKKKRRKKKP